MCGRTCCTLAPELVPMACSAVTTALPRWRDASDGGVYYPSTNIPPTKHTPVLCRGDQVGHKDDSFVVVPMLWGLVPRWHQGEDPTKHKLTTNNARLEGLKESKLYKSTVQEGQRCVVVCDGFYEWKANAADGKGNKQPYLIYAPQPKTLKVEDMRQCTKDEYSEKDGWTGPHLTFMAGLYSIWHQGGDKTKPVYSYTVITRESNNIFSWLHERVPAILPDKDAVMKWLDPKQEGFGALDVLKPLKKDEITWHPVSREVGNTKNHGDDLANPIELDKAGNPVDKKSGSASAMKCWLNKASDNKKDANEVKEEPEEKASEKEGEEKDATKDEPQEKKMKK